MAQAVLFSLPDGNSPAPKQMARKQPNALISMQATDLGRAHRLGSADQVVVDSERRDVHLNILGGAGQ